MKCILCSARKGKRFCPAKNTHICAQCCGEKRVIEIACPADCIYLTEGQSYQSLKKYVSQLQREEDPVRRRKIYEASQRLSGLLFEIEDIIVRFGAGIRSFQDETVLEAISLLLETYKTEEKGLIYEHPTSHPLVQSLFRAIRRALEEKRAKWAEGGGTLRRGDILDCLEVIAADIRYHLENQGHKGSYLDFIARNHPQTTSQRAGGGLIYRA